MPQQASPLPPGFTIIDEGFNPEKQKQDTKPPATPPAPPPAFSQGAGPVSTLGTELLGPFSAMGSDNKFKVPDVITGLMDTMRRNFGMKENIDSAMNKNVDQRASEVAGRGKQMVQATYEPSQKIATGDPQMAVEGFGQALSNALQMLLLSGFSKAKAPAEWQGPVQGNNPPSWQGPIEPQGPPPPTPPRQLNAAPTSPDVIDVPYRTSARGPSTVHEMQPPQRPALNPSPPPEWQGPQAPTGRQMMGPKLAKPPMNPADYYGPRSQPFSPDEFQGPYAPQGPKMPESVPIRGLNPKNRGWFSSVKASDIDPDILRRHLNAHEELTAEALKKTAKAPKPPTKSTPKPKGKK